MKSPEGKIVLSFADFNSMLLKKFGLKIDKDSIHTYQDRYSQNQEAYLYKNPYVFTADFIDCTKKGWANIYGEFYKNHTKKRTSLYTDFKEFLQEYTTTVTRSKKTYFLI